MASSRSMRRSRFPTPLSAPPLDAMSARTEVPLTQHNAASLIEWQEPPLRAPAPSYEDYKGLEKQGVLEFMQPLGTLPSHRVKLRTKQFDSSKRPAYAKNGDPTAAGSEDTSTPDPAPPPPSRLSESRKTEDRTTRVSVSRVKEEDSEYTPNGVSLATPSKAVSSYSSQQGTPSSHLSVRNAKLKEVVAHAMKRADERGDPLVGQALNRLYEQSFYDPLLLDLIDAVLSQRPTESQSKDFRKYLKGARKEIQRETGMVGDVSPTRGTSSDLKLSPVVNNGRNHVSRAKSAPLGAKNHDNSTPTSHPYSPAKPTRRSNKSHPNNTPSIEEQAVPDRSRRSNSTSSLSSVASSLSSVDPNLALQGEEEFGGNSKLLLPPVPVAGGGKVKGPAGPKMGTFIISSSNKRSFAATNPCKEDEELAGKRRKLQQKFPDYKVKDSDIRTSMRQSGDRPVRMPAPPKVQHPAQEVPRLGNGIEGPGASEESDEIDSPTTSMHSELLIPPPSFAGSSRRGTTPTNLGRPPKSTKKSARVKMSPLKKKNGVVAGMARSSGVRNSPIGSRHADGEGLNSDECSACGGPGELLCCDGCTRSYHFTCIDPPKDSLPDGEWYCQACASQPLPPPARGIFPLLRHSLQKKTPTAYNLPGSIRNHYEDVTTGEDGEYEELGAHLSKAKTRTGYDVPLDTFKLKDAKDNIILCYSCNHSALGRREMINCDFCNLYWHLDCIDPPLASAPKKSGKGTWKCPNHVDSDVVVPRSASGKTYKIRRPRDPRVIKPALTRGIKNNGIIEIEDEISEEEDQPPGTIYRIPAMAIRLDFLAKVKQDNAEKRRQRQQQQYATDENRQRKARSAVESLHQKTPFRDHTLAEREAAINLAQLARSDVNSQLGGDRVEELVRTLYAEAPLTINGAQNGDQVLNTANSNNTVSSMNGDLLTMQDGSGHTNAVAFNKAAHAANYLRSVGTPPPGEPQTLLAEEEEILRLEGIVQRRKALIQNKIAAMRAVTASV